MHGYNYDSVVSRTESEALKEMIFKRARERAEQLNKQTQGSYTDSVQNDIMEIAHNSFNSTKNPFAPKTSDEERAKQSLKYRNIGFSERRVKGVNEISGRHADVKKESEASEIERNMESAMNDLQKKKSFTGALDFLNSQATITLAKNKKASFEAIA